MLCILAGCAKNARSWAHFTRPFLRAVDAVSTLEGWGLDPPQRAGLLLFTGKAKDSSVFCPVTQAGTWSHRHGPWDSGVGACEPGSNGNLRPLLLPWVIKLSSASNTHVLCLLPASLKHEQACFVACNRVKPQILHSFSTQAFIAV